MTVYTAGYEGRSLDDFLIDLQTQRVRLLVDVREAPISRKRGFSKTALAAALQSVGIGYLHIRALGCPRPIRDAYRQDHDWEEYSRRFLAYLDGQQEPVDELAELCRQQPTALLCYEADFNRCHRSYVANAVARRIDAPVAHITATGLVMADATTDS
jgi:uncharacterized protein (DUF488 family)